MMESKTRCRICRAELETDAATCFSCGNVIDKNFGSVEPVKPRNESIADKKPIAALLVTVFFVLDGIVLFFVAGLSSGRAGALLAFGVTLGCWIVATCCISADRIGLAYAPALFLVPACFVFAEVMQWVSRII
jgi:hypothetical protein